MRFVFFWQTEDFGDINAANALMALNQGPSLGDTPERLTALHKIQQNTHMQGIGAVQIEASTSAVAAAAATKPFLVAGGTIEFHANGQSDQREVKHGKDVVGITQQTSGDLKVC